MARTGRDYQIAANEAVRDAFRRGVKGVGIEAATGLGKGFIIADIARQVFAKGGRVLVLVNRDNLCDQLSASLVEQGLYPQIERGMDKASPLAEVVVGSIPTLQGERLKKWNQSHFRLVITDECFIAGTLISTPKGAVPIESIQRGDFVTSFNHNDNLPRYRKVIETSKRSCISQIISVRFSNGEKITCTANHPIFSDGKYIPANELTAGAEVLTISKHETSMHSNNQNRKLSPLREGSRVREQIQKVGRMVSNIGRSAKGAVLLFFGVPGQGKVGSKLKVDNRKQSHEIAGDAGEGFNIASRNGMEADCSGRERETSSVPPDTSSFDSRMEDRGCSKDKQASRKPMASMLQVGHCQRGFENRSGDRWKFASDTNRENTGCKKGCAIEVFRVESIEVFQRESDPRTTSMREGCSVYNLEVEEDNNYFASGVLVHNCHFSAAKTFRNTLDYFSSAYHVFMTATMERHDKKGLWSGCEEIVYSMPLQKGIDEGWLVPFDFEELPVPIEITDIQAAKKMWTEKDEVEVFSGKDYLPRLFAEAASRVHDRKALFFWPNCDSSKEAEKHFNELGISSKHVDGYMDKKSINEILAWFKEPGYKSLHNADLLSFGYDNPSIDCVGIMRLSRSIPMLKQRLGRGTRPLCPVDRYPDAATRKMAIAESEKPSVKVLDLMIQLGAVKNKFAESTALITDNDEEKAFIRDEMRKAGKPLSMGEIESKLKVKRETDKEKMLAKLAEDAGNAALKRPRKEPFYADILSKHCFGEDATKKQIGFLRSMGYTGKTDIFKHQASKIIARFLANKPKTKAA